ncbi:hypothetical protein F0P96_00215 [Hymenobacter busanensis]|uniref:Uncharacterized protein n=1 Tax=Hymenobacter busanensis TaxID=2607656 RepID=A0A7L4ZY40_9BACT|nr:hypothetical protein [Hymenobacter busanensis]KAA9339096.1 hypothetical protein F0P96_00215 [Hymenobacter busanensis]QHJ07142.1 hypothetical protein GUY19_07535 [Hymenobacter busanensis]
MKLLFLLLTFFAALFTPPASHQPYAVPALRRQFHEAATDETAGRRFHQLMSQYTERDAVVLAYKAASEAIMAKHTGGLFDKMDRVKAASRQFDEAVSLAPQQPEVRFLRFSIESNLPGFLGASKHVDEDRAFLVKTALQHPKSGLDAEAFDVMRDFLIARNHVSPDEAQLLRRIAQ